MMEEQLEVPDLLDLMELPVEVAQLDDIGVLSVSCWATDNSMVSVVWDQLAASVRVRWIRAEDELFLVARELVEKVSVHQQGGQIEFRVWCDGGALGGLLLICVGESVRVSDVLLRK